jgi:hypothetical protein
VPSGTSAGRLAIVTWIGTDRGLFALDGTGQRTVIDHGPVRALSGRWALVGDEVVTVDDRDVAKIEGGLRAHCLVDAGDGLYVGTSEATLLRLDPRSPERGLERVEGFDRIDGRDGWYTPWGAPPDVRSLAVSSDRALLVNVHVGGVWRSSDGGATWTSVVDVDNDTHQVHADPSNAEVVAAAAVGFGRSHDGGRTWEWSDDGLHASYCRAVALAQATELVTASEGPFSKRGAVYRRPASSDEDFERCRAGLPEWFPFNLDTFRLAAAGDDVVLGCEDGRVFGSADAGGTWDLLATDLGPVRCVALQ